MDKKILSYLINRQNDFGYVNSSIEELTNMLISEGFHITNANSEQVINNALKMLQNSGYIKTINRNGSGINNLKIGFK